MPPSSPACGGRGPKGRWGQSRGIAWPKHPASAGGASEGQVRKLRPHPPLRGYFPRHAGEGARGAGLEELLPAFRAELLERRDIAFDDAVGVREGFDRAGDAVFAEQVQGRPGGAVGAVGDVVGGAAGELVLRVEAGDLEHALELELADQGIGGFEEVVVVAEVPEHVRVHDQGGVGVLGGRVAQAQQFLAELLQQRRLVAGFAQHHAYLALGHHRLGEGAEVEADHGPLHPAVGVCKRVVHRHVRSAAVAAGGAVSRGSCRTAAAARTPCCAAAPSSPAGRRASCR